MKRSREIFTEFEQGGLEWHNIRLGRITASKCAALISNGTIKAMNPNPLKISAALIQLADRKAGEIVNGNYSFHDLKEMYSGKAAERGNELEAQAADRYEQEKGFVMLQEVGFCSLGEYAGASPDRLVNSDGGLELKCPEHPEYMRILREYSRGQIKHKKDYVLQCQFNLFVTGRDWWDLSYYHPKFGENDMIIERIYPDEELHETMSVKLEWFENEVQSLVNLATGNKIIKSQLLKAA